ncbi:MAG: penicillin-binding protein 2 [Caldisericota bacterium]|jgi:stage V sporulation protein D (sporulation-specific penicillin-binding protein)|nr:penicillin-binding protein 2 [Caldisericota bacterium]
MKRGQASFSSVLNRRLAVIAVMVLFALIGIESRFIYLQIFARPALTALANSQLETNSIPIKAKRGMILDANGKILAQDVATWSAGLYMPEVRDVAWTAQTIASVLGVARKDLEVRIRDASLSFIYVQKQVSLEEYESLLSLDIPGMVLDKTYRRIYPSGALVSSVVGVTGTDNQGLSGLEFQYDSLLKGTDGKRAFRVSGSSPGAPAVMEEVSEAIAGKNILLTLDVNVQFFAQQALAETLSAYEGERATCIILNPKTGAVLAMVDAPGVDPEHWREAPDSMLTEKAVSYNYEPGSVFKAVTSAAGLDSNTITATDTFHSSGSLKVFDTVVHDLYAYGTMDLYHMLQYSSNVGFAQLGMKIGASRFFACIQQYGFGKKTGIDLPGEESGIVPPLAQWSKTTLPTMSFGQGVAVTAIQMANFYATIANGGVQRRPYVVDRIEDASGTSQRTDVPGIVGQVVGAETARIVLEGLHGVVKENEGVFSAYIPGYQVAGKTGTAQIAAPGGGYVQDGSYIYSFAGILTANDPRAVVFLSIHETHKGERTSFMVAGPTFKKIALQLIQYLRLEP